MAICLRNYSPASTQKLRASCPLRINMHLCHRALRFPILSIYTMTDDPAATPRPGTSINARPAISGQAPIKAEYVGARLNPYLKPTKIHSLDI